MILPIQQKHSKCVALECKRKEENELSWNRNSLWSGNLLSFGNLNWTCECLNFLMCRKLLKREHPFNAFKDYLVYKLQTPLKNPLLLNNPYAMA